MIQENLRLFGIQMLDFANILRTKFILFCRNLFFSNRDTECHQAIRNKLMMHDK